MTQIPPASTGFFAGGASRVMRDILAALIAMAFLGVMIFLGVMLTAVFLIVAGAAIVAAGAFWLWSKVRRNRARGPEILVATRGPEGWTVDGLGS
tara:strand:+ start:12749 stop:13033 length:285 start_codon:yes stop_codon:yes gene_type:complete